MTLEIERRSFFAQWQCGYYFGGDVLSISQSPDWQRSLLPRLSIPISMTKVLRSLTDNIESIPERYRAKVQVTEQAPKGASDHSAAVKLQQMITDLGNSTEWRLGKFAPNISGLTHYQSQVLSFGGIVAVICLFARLLGRSQVVRFLSLWGLIMLGLTVPALFFTSQDAPLDRLSGQAGKIQEKQQEHLQRAP